MTMQAHLLCSGVIHVCWGSWWEWANVLLRRWKSLVRNVIIMNEGFLKSQDTGLRRSELFLVCCRAHRIESGELQVSSFQEAYLPAGSYKLVEISGFLPVTELWVFFSCYFFTVLHEMYIQVIMEIQALHLTKERPSCGNDRDNKNFG